MLNPSHEADYSSSWDNHPHHSSNLGPLALLNLSNKKPIIPRDLHDLHYGGRIGPKLNQNEKNIRHEFEEAGASIIQDAGLVALSNYKPVHNIPYVSSPVVNKCNSRPSVVENVALNTTKDQIYKPITECKLDSDLSALNSYRAKPPTKSTRAKKGLNENLYDKEEQENASRIPKVRKDIRSKPLETDSNHMNRSRCSVSSTVDLKHPLRSKQHSEFSGSSTDVSRCSPVKKRPVTEALLTDSSHEDILSQFQSRQSTLVQQTNITSKDFRKASTKIIPESEKIDRQKLGYHFLGSEQPKPKVQHFADVKPFAFDTKLVLQVPSKAENPMRLRAATAITQLQTHTPVSKVTADALIRKTTVTSVTAASSSVPSKKVSSLESKKAAWNLSEEEKTSYGDRCPEGYQKLDFLGRGGFALVWLAKQLATGQKVALKQILKKNAKDCLRKEVHFGQMLFGENGTIRDELHEYSGMNNIIKFVDHKQSKTDNWLVFELGGSTLSKSLFEIKGEFFKSERIYNVRHLDLCKNLHANPIYLKAFVRQMAECLRLLSDIKIVHCDLKPDNVLLANLCENSQEALQIKLIDFGSAFSIYEPESLGMATPEYMPPEVLSFLSSDAGSRCSVEELLQRGKCWSIDVWSFGAILLEIVTGVPLWLSLKCRVEIQNKKVFQMGLFAVKGRDYEKIRIKQKAVLEDLEKALANYICDWENPHDFLNLLKRMLSWDPKSRISPEDILKHKFLSV